jgi:hypothetical protein
MGGREVLEEWKKFGWRLVDEEGAVVDGGGAS